MPCTQGKLLYLYAHNLPQLKAVVESRKCEVQDGNLTYRNESQRMKCITAKKPFLIFYCACLDAMSFHSYYTPHGKVLRMVVERRVNDNPRLKFNPLVGLRNSPSPFIYNLLTRNYYLIVFEYSVNKGGSKQGH